MKFLRVAVVMICGVLLTGSACFAQNLQTVFEHTFVRSAGAPEVVVEEFQSIDGGPAIIRLLNGNAEDDAVEKVSSSQVSFNEMAIFDASNFNQNVDILAQPVLLSPGTNKVGVFLKCKPGGSIKVVIQQDSDTLDLDGDGYTSITGDCDDSSAAISPDAEETCNDIDDNCNGQIDEGLTFDVDNDGYTSIGSCEGTSNDCDDSKSAINPGVTELCDGYDNNCSGGIDEGYDLGLSCGFGVCAGGITECSLDGLATICSTDSLAQSETCNEIDDNCNGEIDEGLSDSCGANDLYTSTTCGGTGSDSTQNSDGSATRIYSHLNGETTYGVVGTRRKDDNSVVYMRYLIHEPAGEPKALLVLIAGGYLTAYLQGDANTGTPTSSGGNFLVRSAHLFAQQGYRVITIDRPTDYADWGGDTVGTPYVFDSYRTAVNHAVDLSRIINGAKNGENLPVVLVGTSRGTISAVNQNFLADAIALSSPVTTGNGIYVGTGDNLPQDISIPTHVMWHRLDRCSVTQPSNSELLLYDFPNPTGDELDGGFYDTVKDDPCNAFDYHSFLGVESCAVGTITSWLDSLTFDSTRPDTVTEFSTQNAPINPGETVDIDLSLVVSPKVGGELTYSLPYSTTSLGGTVSLNGSIVTYTPAAGVSGTRDTFVYVVEEVGAGKANNRVVIGLKADVN